MSLQIEKYEHDEQLTLADFLYLFLVDLNERWNTLYQDGSLQCLSCKHRSLGDIHQICITYYPNVTIEEVKETLLNFGSNLVGHYCRDIHKRVYCLNFNNKYISYCQNDNGIDEYDNYLDYKFNNTNTINYELINRIIKRNEYY